PVLVGQSVRHEAHALACRSLRELGHVTVQHIASADDIVALLAPATVAVAVPRPRAGPTPITVTPFHAATTAAVSAMATGGSSQADIGRLAERLARSLNIREQVVHVALLEAGARFSPPAHELVRIDTRTLAAICRGET